MDAQKKLHMFLADPKSFNDEALKVECKETHISRVYLTGKWAFKIKKPLQLPFLDYSTLEARHRACLTEIDINRPYSTNVYEGVVAITQEPDGTLAMDGQGVPVEYAVKMRRLADGDMLDQKLIADGFDEMAKERLVLFLAEVMRKRPRADFRPESYYDHLDRIVRENWMQLVQVSLDCHQAAQPWQALGSRQTQFVRLHRRLIESRESGGSLIEGHGDLRPDHIALEHSISIIDGIEFSRDLRILDIADELSFLSMECAYLGKERIGHDIQRGVLIRMNQAIIPELSAFYESYRALVRAKVHLLRSESESHADELSGFDSAKRYQELAEQRLNKVAPPFAFVIAGAMGSGKTTLARALKDDLALYHIETDDLRRRIFGASERPENYGGGIYTEQARQRVYDAVKKEMLHQLSLGFSVVVDGSFADPSMAQLVLEGLVTSMHPFLLVVCECSDEVAINRIKRRQEQKSSLSEGRVDLYFEQKKRGDWSFSGYHPCRVDTDRPISEIMDAIHGAAGDALQRFRRRLALERPLGS